MRLTLAHDPEKWEPVFGKDHALLKMLSVARSSGSRTNRPEAPAARPATSRCCSRAAAPNKRCAFPARATCLPCGLAARPEPVHFSPQAAEPTAVAKNAPAPG